MCVLYGKVFKFLLQAEIAEDVKLSDLFGVCYDW
jgi:hypothetical protein